MLDEDKTFSGSFVLDLRIWWRQALTLYWSKALSHLLVLQRGLRDIDIFVAFPSSKISSTTRQKLYFKLFDISKQRSTVFRSNGGVFRGNSRITSDSPVYTFRLLYASRNCSEFAYWSWLSEWIVQPDLPCCDLQPLSRVITPRRSEWSLSREPRRIMINSLAKTTLSLKLCFLKITAENLGLLTQFVKK